MNLVKIINYIEKVLGNNYEMLTNITVFNDYSMIIRFTTNNRRIRIEYNNGKLAFSKLQFVNTEDKLILEMLINSKLTKKLKRWKKKETKKKK